MMKKIRVLLVDDDAIILNELKSSIPWANLGFDLIPSATNGLFALELADKHNPHLVITDMAMPAMDGIEFCSKLRLRHPDIHIIVLSCHNDFSYVRHAVSVSVDDYILKTEMDFPEIIKKLIRIRRNILNDLTDSAVFRQLKLEKQIASLLSDNSSDIDYKTLFSAYENQKQDFLVLSPAIPLHLSSESLHAFFQPLLQNMHDFLAVAFSNTHLSPADLFLLRVDNFIILSLKKPDTQFLSQLTDSITQTTDFFLFYFEGFALYDFCMKLRDMAPIIRYLLLFPEKRIYRMHDMKATKIIPSDIHFSFHSLSEEQSVAEKMRGITDYLNCLYYRYKDYDNIIRFYQSYCFYMEHTFHGRFHPPGILALHCFPDFPAWISNNFSLMEACGKTEPLPSYSYIVKQTIDILLARYHDPMLTTEQIAGEISLSAGRLRVLFKRETGKTINAFLTDIRIKEACHLLTHSNMRMYEIANSIGYQSSQYFTRIFTQRMHVKPIDYRQGKGGSAE